MLLMLSVNDKIIQMTNGIRKKTSIPIIEGKENKNPVKASLFNNFDFGTNPLLIDIKLQFIIQIF